MAENVPEGLTFDDLLLVPQHSDVLPAEVSTETYLTRNVRLTSRLSAPPWIR